MLRKTYRLMQKTRALLPGGDEGLRVLAPAGETPDHFACCPPGFVMGDADRGAALIAFAFDHTPAQLGALLGPAGDAQLDAGFHDFNWLLDLRAARLPHADKAATLLIDTWITTWTDPHTDKFSAQKIAVRLIHLVESYAFFMPALTPERQTNLIRSFAAQKAMLKPYLKSRTPCLVTLAAACAYTIGSVALGQDDEMIDAGLSATTRALQALLNPDGGPVSRRADDLVPMIRLTLSVRDALSAAGKILPADLIHILDRMVAALKFFDKGDGHLPSFHGSRVADSHLVRSLLHHANLNGKAPASLSQTGYEKLCAGGSTLILDSLPRAHPSQHSSITALEFSHRGQDVIINCGPHIRDKTWQDLLAATAAHSAFILDESDNTPLHGHAKAEIARLEDAAGTCLALTHDGYMTRNGFTHTRRIFLSTDGMDLRGEDRAAADTAPLSPLPYAIRFHIHPDIHVTPVSNGHSAALRLPCGTTFYLHHDGERLSVEDSVYLAQTGLPQKTKQIVIAGMIIAAQKTIHWAFKGEVDG